MQNKGTVYGFLAYFLWGIFPLYIHLLKAVAPLEIIYHRIVWSFLLMALVMFVRRDWGALKTALRSPKILVTFMVAAVLLSTNWFIYVWGVNNGHVVETSLGYFINPLVSVALGVVILREKLRPFQWLPVGLATLGVLYLTLQYGKLPWIALALAFTFGTYGLVKKISPLASIPGLTLETGLLFVPAAAILLGMAASGGGAFGHQGLGNSVLLALAGVVTTVPLLLFSSAAQAIPLSALGLLQYISPTCQFLIGVLVFREPFSTPQFIGFSIIWAALVIFTAEGIIVRRRAVQVPA